ncbi:MAG: rhomboid family intramembrane serine protease [Gemmataceae bacterium]|nr:rhomboid family intramembrane serine protease [Gemmataceae bacterium]
MGLDNRDYYRNTHTGDPWGWEALTPVVKYLILANVAVFLLQIFVVRPETRSPLEVVRKYNRVLDKYLAAKEADDQETMEAILKRHPELDYMLSEEGVEAHPAFTSQRSIVQEWFELDSQKVVYSGQVWRLVTHAFCHDRLGIWHILFNMLCLYWFGSTLESMYGSREFLRFYLVAAVFAGLAFVGLDMYTGSTSPGIGASGAVMGVMMLYTMHYPYDTIRIFWLVPVEMRIVMLGYILWDTHPVLLALAGQQQFTGIAHAAHLGGLIFGFAYYRYGWRLENLSVPWPRWRSKKRPRLRVVSAPAIESIPDPQMDRVDELLQKIFELGQDSLTDEERAILENASARLRNRGQRDR